MTPILGPSTIAALLSILHSLALPPESTTSSPQTPPTSSILKQSPFQQEVIRNRQFKQAGVTAGGGLMAAALGTGVASGILDPWQVLVPTTAAVTAAALYTQSFNEEADPLPMELFEVKPSGIENAGQGLFATCDIPADTYLFSYGGGSLTEQEYFRRYPNRDNQGRYVAFVEGSPFLWGGEPTYIDGSDPDTSGLARWANSMPDKEGSNMYKKPQRLGPNAGTMYMYASRDIKKGEELFHDYGQDYWTAVEQETETEAEEDSA